MITGTLTDLILIIIYIIGIFVVSGKIALMVFMFVPENTGNIMTWYGKLALIIWGIVTFFLSWLAMLMLIVLHFIPYNFIYKDESNGQI